MKSRIYVRQHEERLLDAADLPDVRVLVLCACVDPLHGTGAGANGVCSNPIDWQSGATDCRHHCREDHRDIEDGTAVVYAF